MNLLLFLAIFVTASGLINIEGIKGDAVIPVDLCFDKRLDDIPSDHLFHSKSKPLIIGHRGNPKVFQENTLDGFKSLVDLGADGYETDIYLTKDNKLALYHDDNTKLLTGVDRLMWDMTAAEIQNLNVKKILNYNNLTYIFSKQRKIPMLEDLLNATKDTGLLMYLEMKPSHNPRWDVTDTKRSKDTGKAVAQMVTRLGLEKQVFLVSFDPVKVWAAKQENPKLVIGSFYRSKDWKRTIAELQTLKAQYQAELPGLTQCFSKAPNGSSLNGNALVKFLFNSGTIFKAINASFIDMDYKIYNNPMYSNNTFSTLKNNYSPKVSAGAWTIYSMKMTLKEVEASENQVGYLIAQGAQRLITDDVPRLRKKLGRDKQVPGGSFRFYANAILIMVSVTVPLLKAH